MNRFSSMIARFVRGLVIATACAVMLFTTASPVLAIGTTPSQPEQGETRLNDIYKESQDSIRPENALDADTIIERGNKGLNEVQEDADIDKMSRPSNSREATSAAEQVQRALGKAVDKVTGKD